jgi:hypothetical protein
LTGTPPELFYTPELGFPATAVIGVDEFTFMVNDGIADSEIEAVFTVMVVPQIDPAEGGLLKLSGVHGGSVVVDIPPIPGQTAIYPSMVLASITDLMEDPSGVGFVEPYLTERYDIDTILNITVEDWTGLPITDLSNNPITVSIPFTPQSESGIDHDASMFSSHNAPDTIVLVDSAGNREFLPTVGCMLLSVST